MSDLELEELTEKAELEAAYPVMEQLRPVGEERFLELVATMREESDYQLFALRDDADGEIRALAGVVVQTNLYHGKHAWVHDLVVDEPYRGEGYGTAVLEWVEEWADERDCSCMELASGLWRDEAHRFYEKVGMEKYCYTFKKDLNTPSPY
jgi:GNAT superfamily N-acetyltransferase